MDPVAYDRFINRLRLGEAHNRPVWAGRRWVIMEACDVFGSVTLDNLATLMNLHYEKVYILIDELHEEGLIEIEVAPDKNPRFHRNKRFRLTDYGKTYHKSPYRRRKRKRSK